MQLQWFYFYLVQDSSKPMRLYEQHHRHIELFVRVDAGLLLPILVVLHPF